MSFHDFMLQVSMNLEGLNPLLPHIAGVIETLEEATFVDIKSQIEGDLDRRISSTVLNAGLESGIKLGLFSRHREFKVCREFTTKELRKVKNIGDHLTSASKKLNALSMSTGRCGKDVLEYVKRERKERRKKLYKKKRSNKLGLGKDYGSKTELYKYLCQRCKKSLEKELLRDSSSPASTESAPDDKMSGSPHRSMSASECSYKARNRSHTRGRNSEDKKKPEKSRLLIEKNPLETEPPYYDIFT